MQYRWAVREVRLEVADARESVLALLIVLGSLALSGLVLGILALVLK